MELIKVILTGLIILIINIPFGYWRSHVRRFSLQWMLAIHLPVLLVIALRMVEHIGYEWYTFVVFATGFIIGQQIGSIIIRRIRLLYHSVSSCLVMDLYRFMKQH